MILVEAIALVTYTCCLTDEDEKKVRDYAEENNCSLDTAINELWNNNEIDVYSGGQTESDCSTQSVGYSEFNNEKDMR